MPLTKKGKSLKKKFEQQYGKGKGDSVFYATANGNPKFDKVVHGKKKSG